MKDFNLEHAIDLIKSHQISFAQAVLIRLLRQNIRNEAAWLWLAVTMDNPRKIAYCLHRVVQINPNNARARQYLFRYLRAAKRQNLPPLSASSPYLFNLENVPDCRIEKLGLPIKTYQFLIESAITRTEELANATQGDLSSLPGITTQAAIHIKRSLSLLATQSEEATTANDPKRKIIAQNPVHSLGLSALLEKILEKVKVNFVDELLSLTGHQRKQILTAHDLDSSLEQELENALDKFQKSKTGQFLPEELANPDNQPEVSLTSKEKSKHTVISNEPGYVEILNMPHITHVNGKDAAEQLEKLLLADIGQLDLIGELNITSEIFEKMCVLVRRVGLSNGRVRPNRVPPALFVTTMVFTARYTTEQARNFWTPYARMVWRQNEASPAFQNKCRKQFAYALRYLDLQIGITFKRQSTGEVVRPIFRHAIIPAYLQDNFAQWLKNQWEKILEIPTDSLANELSQDQSVDSLPIQLQNFIRNSDTAEAAASLITKMAAGAALLAEGETVEEVSEQFSKSPIERAIWDELSRVFEVHSDRVAQKQASTGQIRWVWSMEYHEMQLQLLNFTFPKDNIPDKVVWTKNIHSASEIDVEELLNPWETNEGNWWLDEILLTDGPINGTIKILDNQRTTLLSRPVPLLPRNQMVFFRPDHRDIFARPLEDLTRLRDGFWCVSHEKGVRLEDADNNPIYPIEDKPVPFLLDEVHDAAGLYELKLPIKILQHEQVIARIDQQTDSNPDQALLHGESLIEGLSHKIPPVFTDNQIYLTIPGISSRLLTRLVLWLKSERDTWRYPLIYLQEEGILDHFETQSAVVDLSKLIPLKIGSYTIQLRQNLQPLLTTPIRFAVLPNISVQAPNSALIYTPNNLPFCIIKGVQVENIGESDRYTVARQEKNKVKITWHDLKEDECQVQLFFDLQPVTLSWSVKRLFSWLSPQPEADFLRFDELTNYTFNVVSPRKYARYFLMWLNEDEKKRQVDFNRRGHYSSLITKDTLFDMIQGHTETETTICVSVYNQAWQLFKVRRQPKIKRIGVAYKEDQQNYLSVTCLMEEDWPGEYQFILHDLDNLQNKPVAVWSRDKLQKQTSLPANLADGHYLLEILCNGLRVNPSNSRATIPVGKLESLNLKTDDIFSLLDAIKSRKVSYIDRDLAHDFIRLLKNQLSNSQTGLAESRFFQLATLPAEALEKLSSREIEFVWSTLAGLVYAYRIGRDNNTDNLLPGWAVTDKPLWIKLEGYHEPQLLVRPERAGLKGHIGIGTTTLKLGYPQPEPRETYIRWGPGEQNKLQILLGLLDPDAPRTIQDIDELDLEPVYQCTQCGRFIYYRDWEKVKGQHVHRSGSPTQVDVLNEPVVHGFLISRQSGWLDFEDPPDKFVDRHYVLNSLEKLTADFREPASYYFSQEGYGYAAYCWLSRIQESGSTKQQLLNLTRNGRWYTRLRAFERSLEDANNARIPAFAALHRFLIAFDSGHIDFPLLQLDRIMLLLAMLLRVVPYYPDQANQLFEQLHLSLRDLNEMLKLANKYCPELLAWAFAWTEAFLTHARS